jgi:hypothetical protein
MKIVKIFDDKVSFEELPSKMKELNMKLSSLSLLIKKLERK